MKKLSIFIVLFLAVSISNLYAQFEGKIEYDIYEMNEEGDQEDRETFRIYFTADRILLMGEEKYNVGGSLETEGLLIRLDKDDFVLLTGDKQAMKISKAGITSFMNMFGAAEAMEAETADVSISFNNTGETENINGYSTEKFVVTNEDEPNKETIIWMTQDLNINWGMLAEPWGDAMSFFTEAELPKNLIFEEGYFPLKLEHYEDGVLRSAVIAEVSTPSDVRSMVQISPDVEVLSLQNYLFQQMREEQ